MYRFVLSLLSLFSIVCAQTITTTDPQGETVVGVVTVDTNNAGPTFTSIVSTLGQSTSTTSSTTITAQIGQLGPVGQPAPTTATAGAPITYIYTTVVNGEITQIFDTFTPTDISTTPVTPTETGTILDLSDWLSMNAQQTGGASNSAWRTRNVPPMWLGVALAGLVFMASL